MLMAKKTVMSSIMSEAKSALNENSGLPSNAIESVVELPYKDLVSSPFNEGLELETLDQLVADMERNGFKLPIIVYDLSCIPGKDGQYEILSGHTRVEAWCKILGHNTVSSIIRPYPKDAIIRFEEHKAMNQINRSLNSNFWAVEIENAKKALKESGFTGTVDEEMSRISQMLGKGKSSLYRYIAVNQLVPNLRKLEGEAVGVIALYEATKLNEEQQEELATFVKDYHDSYGTVSKSELKKKIQDIKAKADPSKPKNKSTPEKKKYVNYVYEKAGEYTKFVRNLQVKAIDNEEDKQEVLETLRSIIQVTNNTIESLTKDE